MEGVKNTLHPPPPRCYTSQKSLVLIGLIHSWQCTSYTDTRIRRAEMHSTQSPIKVTNRPLPPSPTAPREPSGRLPDGSLGEEKSQTGGSLMNPQAKRRGRAHLHSFTTCTHIPKTSPVTCDYVKCKGSC